MAGWLPLFKPTFTDVTGRSQVGLGGAELNAQTCINVFKVWNCVPSGGATPANLDATGYPTSPFTGIVGGQIVGLIASSLLSAGPWVISWPATRGVFRLVFLASANTNSTTGSPTITNGSGSGNYTIVNTNGLAGSVTFTFTSTPANLTLSFEGSSGTIAYTAGSGEMTMMRTSDVSKYAAGQIFSDEYLAVLRTLNLGKIRTMGWVNNGNANACSYTKWKYRNTLTCLTWSGGLRHPDAWAGTYAGPDFYTGSRSTDMPSGAWLPHETWMATTTGDASASITISAAANNGSGAVRLTVSSSATLTTNQDVWVYTELNSAAVYNAVYLVTVIDGTHIDLQGSTFTTNATGAIGVQTITPSGKSKKFLANDSGTPIGSSYDSFNAGTYQFYYDETIDKVILSDLTTLPPIEAHAKLANALNCHLWTTLPHWADDDFATNWATTILNTLNSHLNWYTEYSSEMWNTGFRNGIWATSKGKSLGLAPASFYALRYRQVMGLFTTAWAGNTSRLRRCINTISLPSLITGINKYYVFDGTELGSYGYNASPSRPIDYCDVLIYAPYAGGCNLCLVSDNGKAFAAANAPALQNIVTLWEASNFAGAIAAIDDDIRQGRCLVKNVTASGTTFTAVGHIFQVGYHLAFQVTGGTTYSGLSTGKLYDVTGVTTDTFTIRAFGSNGLPSGANINAGTAGSGTTTVGYTNNMTTLHGAANEVHRGWEAVCASYDADRPGGLAALKHHWYEGALELAGPDASTATTLGLTGSNPSASIAAAILAWKNSATAAATIQAYYNTYKGLDSTLSNYQLMLHAEDAANLVLYGGNIYSLVSGINTSDPVYELYNGVAAYNA